MGVLASVVVVGALSIGTTGVAAAMGANPPKPTVSGLVATPPSLSSSGGAVTLSANVTNATSCTFTSNKPVAGLPATIPCSNGTFDQNATAPINTRVKAITYKFKLAVTGTKTVHARVEVTESSGYHVLPGSQWTLQELSFIAMLPSCTIETFLPGHGWRDDIGRSGRYGGGAQSISETFGKGPGALTGTWNSTTNDYVGTLFVGARPAYTITLSPGVTAGC
jgi:hypothetical protein